MRWAFMTANYVGRALGYAGDHDWMANHRATAAQFRGPEFAERFEDLIALSSHGSYLSAVVPLSAPFCRDLAARDAERPPPTFPRGASHAERGNERRGRRSRRPSGRISHQAGS